MAVRRGAPRDVNGYPPPIYPWVKTLLGCGYGGFSPPMGILVGDSFTHRVWWVWVHSCFPHTRHPLGFIYI
jgi:hypothetical protein